MVSTYFFPAAGRRERGVARGAPRTAPRATGRTYGLPRAVADLPAGLLIATVEVDATPERVFRALASGEITRWWARSGVFDTRQWSGDVRPGGHWHASGVARGQPYTLEGEFLEVDPPLGLVHTWSAPGSSAPATTVAYVLEDATQGTRLTLRHAGFASRATCENTAMGWETSLAELVRMLASDAGG